MKRIELRSPRAADYDAHGGAGQSSDAPREPFAVKDCALVAIATGERAQNLKEFRDRIQNIHPGSIYYHFWGRLLRPRFDNPEYINDFAVWAESGLNDATLAERLAVIDPTDFSGVEQLREHVVATIEERLDETDWISWSKADNQFSFIRSQIVVFDTSKRIEEPSELADVVPHLSVGSVFYHFIDARRRSDGHLDDFRAWLGSLGEGHRDLCMELAGLDPYFVSLSQMRQELADLFSRYFKGGHE